MSPQANIYIIFALAMILLLYLAFRLYMFMGRRAICQVISIFRKYDAIDQVGARSAAELKLTPKPMFTTFLRDYKPWALQALLQAGVIRATVDGLLYLNENKEDVIASLGCPVNVKKAGNSNRPFDF